MTNKNKTIKKIDMDYRLAFLLFLTACASDYPSPYAPDYKPTSATGTQGVWAPPLVRTTASDTSFTGYYASLRPFPADKRVLFEKPAGLLDLQGVAAREGDLSRRRDAEKQKFTTDAEIKRLADKEAGMLAEREAIKKRQY